MPHSSKFSGFRRIVSNGHTDTGRAAFDWAIVYQLDQGGWCPKGRRAFGGEVRQIPFPDALSQAPLPDAAQCAEWNVRDSDATVLFTLTESLEADVLQVSEFARHYRRPWLHFRPGIDPKFLALFVIQYKVGTLNVAGPSELTAPGIYRFVYDTLEQALAPLLAADRPATTDAG